MAIQLIRISEALQIDTSLLRHVKRDERMKTFKDSRRRNCIEREDLADFYLSAPWYARKLFTADSPVHLRNLLTIMQEDYNRLTGRSTMLYFGTDEIGELLGVGRLQAAAIIRNHGVPYTVDGNSYFVHEYDFVQFLKANSDYCNKLEARTSENQIVEDIRKRLIRILNYEEITTPFPRCTERK